MAFGLILEGVFEGGGCVFDDPLPDSGNIHTKNLQNQCGHQGKVHEERPTQLYYC